MVNVVFSRNSAVEHVYLKKKYKAYSIVSQPQLTVGLFLKV